MDDEQPHQELVKCVLVGDNAVGKTRLICARACRQKVSLSQLLNPHVPTVWAIDQYRIYKEVLENSMMVLDGVNVSLRLWDTFGDHHKDRRFAYLRSDVVLMCFDIGKQSSLENCREMWYPQIRKFCPNTPVILVGCKNDVRFIHRDQEYINYCRERSPLVRQAREQDLVMPEQAHAVAKELGLPYYETSVLTYFGVDELFENAIRAALCFRRQQRFWLTNLRRVTPPALQEPFCPPPPKLPEVSILPSQMNIDQEKLFYNQNFTDVIISCGSVGFSAHRFILAASSPFLHRLLTTEHLPATRSSSETSLLSNSLNSATFINDVQVSFDESDFLISNNSVNCSPIRTAQQLDRKNLRRRSTSFHTSPTMMRWRENLEDSQPNPGLYKSLNHPALHSLQIQHCESLDLGGRIITSVQTILNCTKIITPRAMRHLIHFIYTGRFEMWDFDIGEIKMAAELLNITDLSKKIMEDENQNSKESHFDLVHTQRNIEELCLNQGLFADILVRLDDGTLSAHKPILMSRCDMMLAMFSHEDFIESSAKVIKFPGVSQSTFKELLYFLYTDKPPRVSPDDCIGVIELANRLCLPRLVSLTEEVVISHMSKEHQSGEDVIEQALKLLQPSQLHNAEQLSEWCLAYLSQSYNQMCRKYPKVLRDLHPENQAWLNVHRWPPIWYVKDHDYYQRMQVERAKQVRPKGLKRARNQSGCLCFSSKSKKGVIH